MGFNWNTQQQPPLESLLAAMTRYPQNAIPHTPALALAPAFILQRPQGGSNYAQYTPQDLALRERDLATRLADLNRTRLPRATMADAYTAHIAEYNRLHGNSMPTEQRAYPLTPGTADIGSRECLDCGYVHGEQTTCGHEHMSFKECIYRITANVILRVWRQGPPRAPARQPDANVLLLQLLQHFQATQQTAGGGHQDTYVEDGNQGNGNRMSG